MPVDIRVKRFLDSIRRMRVLQGQVQAERLIIRRIFYNPDCFRDIVEVTVIIGVRTFFTESARIKRIIVAAIFRCAPAVIEVCCSRYDCDLVEATAVVVEYRGVTG